MYHSASFIEKKKKKKEKSKMSVITATVLGEYSLN